MNPNNPLQLELQAFALHQAATVRGQVQYRHAGADVSRATHVLLHGIGSGSGSWLRQLQAAQGSACSALAWDAPGYGPSSPVGPSSPHAVDYAESMWDWLDALQVRHPVTLVGHSLGALMAAQAAVQQPERVQRLVLLAPALGYGNAPAEERDRRRSERLDNLAQLGPQGIAEKRGAAMLSSGASAELLAYVQSIMAAIVPAGYTQAVHLLMNADLFADLARLRCPVSVASGSADTITPAKGCERAAAAAGGTRLDLGAVGHACALEAPAAVNALLQLPASDRGLP